MDYLRLVRYKNLIFITLVMILMQFCIVKPIENAFGFASDDTSLMPDYIFWMLTAATVLISAGGYAINDYFDTKIDLLNKIRTESCMYYAYRRNFFAAVKMSAYRYIFGRAFKGIYPV